MSGNVLVVYGTARLVDTLDRLLYMLDNDGDEIVACFNTLIDVFVPITQ